MAGEVYEPETIEYLTSQCREGDVVHAGTYFGDFLPALARACAPGQVIWAFEPNLENWLCALITAHINHLQNVRLTQAGLSDRAGTGRLLTTDEGGQSLGGSSRLLDYCDHPSISRAAEVPLVTIDETVPEDRHVAAIHLDVEGSEGEALAGALRTIQRCRPALVLESVPHGEWFSDAILELGYRAEQMIEGNSVFAAVAATHPTGFRVTATELKAHHL